MKTSVFSLGDKVMGTVNIALFGAFQVMLVVKNPPAKAGAITLRWLVIEENALLQLKISENQYELFFLTKFTDLGFMDPWLMCEL